MFACATTAHAAESAQQVMREVIGPVLGIVISAVLLAVLGYSIHRWFKRQGEPSRDAGFTLADLRQLHRDGEMSTEEFEMAKAQIIGAAKAQFMKQDAEKNTENDLSEIEEVSEDGDATDDVEELQYDNEEDADVKEKRNAEDHAAEEDDRDDNPQQYT